ncbi:MAG: hypothetical protein M3Y07_08000, partial [Acidobacteriota bacterium]|nr:hypothetical protein [Acidobacteriota bacterium]
VKIDNAEAAHPDAAAAVEMKTFIVRSPMANGIAHGLDGGEFRRPIPEEITRDSAHRDSNLEK